MTDQQKKAILKDYRWFLKREADSYSHDLESVKRAIAEERAYPSTVAKEQAGVDEMNRRIAVVDKLLNE